MWQKARRFQKVQQTGVSPWGRDLSEPHQGTAVLKVKNARHAQDVFPWVKLNAWEKYLSTQVKFLISGKIPIMKWLTLPNAPQFPVLAKTCMQKPHQACYSKTKLSTCIIRYEGEKGELITQNTCLFYKYYRKMAKMLDGTWLNFDLKNPHVIICNSTPSTHISGVPTGVVTRGLRPRSLAEHHPTEEESTSMCCQQPYSTGWCQGPGARGSWSKETSGHISCDITPLAGKERQDICRRIASKKYSGMASLKVRLRSQGFSMEAERNHEGLAFEE